MTKARIAIIGSGGIGRRHLQSCCELPADQYSLFVVDPSDEARAETQKAIEGRAALTVEWLSSLAQLPKNIDAAIIATRSDTRADIIQNLTAVVSVKYLLLEKFLFQRRSEYKTVGDLLAREHINAWVNCPTRIWLGYRELHRWMRERKVISFKMSGSNWDIGCNAIHYLDLFAYLLGSTRVTVNDVELGAIMPAKREGMLHIEGVVRGTIIADDGREVPYAIVSDPAAQNERIVEVAVANDAVRSVEGINSMTVHFPDSSDKIYPIPFQSQITGSVVAAILGSGDPGLPTYVVSRHFHEAMLDGFLTALNKRGLLDDRTRCPIT